MHRNVRGGSEFFLLPVPVRCSKNSSTFSFSSYVFKGALELVILLFYKMHAILFLYLACRLTVCHDLLVVDPLIPGVVLYSNLVE